MSVYVCFGGEGEVITATATDVGWCGTCALCEEQVIFRYEGRSIFNYFYCPKCGAVYDIACICLHRGYGLFDEFDDDNDDEYIQQLRRRTRKEVNEEFIEAVTWIIDGEETNYLSKEELKYARDKRRDIILGYREARLLGRPAQWAIDGNGLCPSEREFFKKFYPELLTELDKRNDTHDPH